MVPGTLITINSQSQQQPSQFQRLAQTSLPFLSLYKPLSQPIAIASGSIRTLLSAGELVESIRQGNAQAIPLNIANTCLSTLSVAGTVFAHPIGMLLSSGQDSVRELLALARHVQDGKNTEAMESCGHLVNNILFTTMLLGGGSQLAAAYFGTQALTALYHSIAEFKQGNYIEGSGHALMALLRSYELGSQMQPLLQERNDQENFQEKITPKDESIVPAHPQGENPQILPILEPEKTQDESIAPAQPHEEVAHILPVLAPEETQDESIAPAQPQEEVAHILPVLAPEETQAIPNKNCSYDIIPDTAQYKGCDYTNAIRVERGISLDQAFEIANNDPEIDYFVHIKGWGIVLEIPPYVKFDPSKDPLNLVTDQSYRYGYDFEELNKYYFKELNVNYCRIFSRGDTVFFKSEGRWLGTAPGMADTYIKNKT